MYSQVTLIGRITKNPEVKTSTKGNVVARFSLACDRRYADENGERKTDFHECVCFGKTAENLEKYVKKGYRLFVQGELENNDFEDSKGNKRKSTYISVDKIIYLENKEKEEANKPELAPIDDDSLPF